MEVTVALVRSATLATGVQTCQVITGEIRSIDVQKALYDRPLSSIRGTSLSSRPSATTVDVFRQSGKSQSGGWWRHAGRTFGDAPNRVKCYPAKGMYRRDYSFFQRMSSASSDRRDGRTARWHHLENFSGANRFFCNRALHELFVARLHSQRIYGGNHHRRRGFPVSC